MRPGVVIPVAIAVAIGLWLLSRREARAAEEGEPGGLTMEFE